MHSPPPTSSPLTPLPDEDNLEEAVSSSDSGYISPDSEPDRVFERKRLDHLIGQIDAFDDWMFSGDRHGKPVFQPLPPSSPPSAPQQISCPYHRGVGGTPPQHYQQTLATWSPAQPWEEDEGDHEYDPVEVNGYGEPLSSDYPQSYPDDLFGPHEPYAHAVPVALSPSVEGKRGFLSTPVTSNPNPGETTPQRKPRLSAKDVSSPSLSDKASSEHLYNARQDPPSPTTPPWTISSRSLRYIRELGGSGAREPRRNRVA
ncbi:hypothetical protein QFC21_005595 [Naganishia friedmannii]|uniref:Uncharacterized protein n=1 Tax=Naganishia friedmannii TaxID=89922 RepID=A0ACC2V793_9TREE|nr:hypothetical protein QFC21_005595 [Naganishia friedmannii]